MMMQMKSSSHRRRMIENAPEADFVASVIVEAATAKEPNQTLDTLQAKT